MRYNPISSKMPKMIHGADYNPEQWKNYEGIWQEDMRLMKLAKCNSMTVGMFSWAELEPREGVFTFEWLDDVMDMVGENDGVIVLGTPSGARPAWMSQTYPQVLRVADNGIRNKHGHRHNHCYTSPIYRQKTQDINRRLAERYKNHPALGVWHISNEFGGECHCDLCQEAFREWLKVKYHHDLEELNHAWWTSFWSHTYSDWSQIESPSSIGENLVHGHNLDWKRFVTHQTVDFYLNEIVPLREITPDIPITTNLMGTYPGLDQWKFGEVMDVVSWDNYPLWHSEQSDIELASDIGFVHDLNRSLKKGQPFMMMESTPSMTNWQRRSKLKRPKMHLLSSIQAIAHGADSVQYFQWRKSRGACEKFHGAVVDHCGHEHTRVFSDVKDVGEVLEQLDDVVGTSVKPEVAIIYDWEILWALEDAQGLNNEEKYYEATVKKHYQPFWDAGVPVDIIDASDDLDQYKILIAPMLYMVKAGVGEKIDAFVKQGGTFVATYCSGMVDENDLCFLSGFPGPLRQCLGIWSEETDSLFATDNNYVQMAEDSPFMPKNKYPIKQLCDIIHCETAQPLAFYGNDFYEGMAALTVNTYGKGKAYYMAFRNNATFEKDFYSTLIQEVKPLRALDVNLPEGVTAQMRTDGTTDYVFLMNFSEITHTIPLDKERRYRDMLSPKELGDEVTVEGWGLQVLVRKH